MMHSMGLGIVMHAAMALIFFVVFVSKTKKLKAPSIQNIEPAFLGVINTENNSEIVKKWPNGPSEGWFAEITLL